jgi:hypothetical protein
MCLKFRCVSLRFVHACMHVCVCARPANLEDFFIACMRRYCNAHERAVSVAVQLLFGFRSCFVLFIQCCRLT